MEISGSLPVDIGGNPLCFAISVSTMFCKIKTFYQGSEVNVAQPNFDFNIQEENIHMELAILPSQIFEAGELVADTRRSLDEYNIG